MPKFRWGATALTVGLASLAGCTARRLSGKPLVVCTTGMVADLARRVGEPEIAVYALMGPGTDPHLYKPTEGDLQRLAKATLVLYNGLHLEGKMGLILGRLARVRSTVAVASAIPPERLRYPPEAEGKPDPHVWHDVSLWIYALQRATDALCERFPQHEARFRARSLAYQEELQSLHEWCQAQIAQIAPSQRVLITSHDAFGYFGRAYGLEVRSLQGISTLSEYGLRDLWVLAEFIVQRRIKAIFAETSLSPRALQAVIARCRQRGHLVRLGGTLYSDALGPPNSDAATYVGMIRHNVRTIVNALR
ncbi:MAG: zinc ABC transporter substrate-binding protein [Armatimonadota bacterium]